ncbi:MULTISPECIES: adenosylhomocysteinase [unclassified Serratia (in: enterobacteria)]|uniref:adenosylhomocysteinase n=1 Tax=unclassified Serratia (in: enterobacteria) TaxID=2647522 RepID=UPI0005077F52|nr:MULTISPECIES: adenosylhomocysteinase [unclassified Serratia (in: enterobacteria)]KFK95507.1 adenosylhomocysteinase [Serratia sp. Ag2]KFL00479.1 adenosylhomocysteinase [Serratia sp. Ag1]
MYQDFDSELSWAMRNMPRTRAAVAALPDLHGVRLACNMHLDLKMAPLVAGLLGKGAAVYLTTCNPTTVQDDVVAWLERHGAQAYAWRNMGEADWSASFDRALAWNPTHLCEMGADLTTRLHQSESGPQIKAGLEATGSGINRLGGIAPRYPIFNWDDLPVKEGLHNRHMVGLTAWHTFFQTTHLTLHEKCVLVIGYGLVGQGVAAAAKAYGGQVIVAEIDPARALQARYDGWAVVDLAAAVAQADVIATATGAKNVLSAEHLKQAKDGVFILNVGHVAEEIDVGFLQNLPCSEPLPFVNAYALAEKTLYLLANGSMFNLTAGYGDSLNAFDVTLAVMAAGIGHIVGAGAQQPAGVYLLPQSAWQTAL